ncbi:hypothetical protein AB0D37_06850 [Streptomyces sp. NPDC048384]|uniref:hypothetical protein n=1 Tax=Streptomyces sp. NPDC048384 TaxID=3155487 RepID=UPI0034154413
MRINWNKERPTSLWKHEMLGSLVFTAIAALLWWLLEIPWWVPVWFGANALASFLRLLERRPAKGRLTVTEVQATTVRVRQFKL